MPKTSFHNASLDLPSGCTGDRRYSSNFLLSIVPARNQSTSGFSESAKPGTTWIGRFHRTRQSDHHELVEGHTFLLGPTREVPVQALGHAQVDLTGVSILYFAGFSYFFGAHTYEDALAP